MADRWIGRALLHRAVCETFHLAPELVDVIDDLAELKGPAAADFRILVQRTRREGRFPLQFDVFVGGDDLERPIVELAGTVDRARKLATRPGAVLLLGTGPIGHDEQLRVAPDGTVDIVELDGDELDGERFVIIGSRPFTEQPTEARAKYAV